MANISRKVWIRLGDQGDYESYDSPNDAGIAVGDFMGVTGQSMTPIGRANTMGVTVGSFQGDDYISLFWGDDDAQPVKRAVLSDKELSQFESGILEGMAS